MRKYFFLFLFIPMMALAADLPLLGWGVVADTATLYDKTGKKLGEVTGGEPFRVYKVVSINKEPAYYIEIHYGKKLQKCVVPSDACHAVLNVDEVNEAAQEALSQYYSALSMRTALEARARERYFAKTPVAELTKMKKDLARIPAKDREYEKAMEAAKNNSERLRYRDLRKALRYEATGLQAQLARAKQAAEAWEKVHPFDATKVQQTGTWKRLTQRLEELKVNLATFEIVPVKE